MRSGTADLPEESGLTRRGCTARLGVLLLALMAPAIQGLETDRQVAFLNTNPAEKVPVVGAAFQVNAVPQRCSA
jgi:hypothetical protein